MHHGAHRPSSIHCDGDPGDGDGDGETGEASSTTSPGDGDGDGDESGDGDGDGDACDALGHLMAPCDDESLLCPDGWTCHFYPGGTSGSCSPPCETDADCYGNQFCQAEIGLCLTHPT